MAAVRDHFPTHIDRNPAEGVLGLRSTPPAVRIARAPRNREHRHWKLLARDVRLIVGHILRRGAIKIEAGPHRAGLGIGADVFGEGLRIDGIWPEGEGAIEPGKVDILAPSRECFR